MIYCQMVQRARVHAGQELLLHDVARLMAPPGAECLTLPCPHEPGVWRLEAIVVARVLQTAYPGEDIRLMGADVCYVHRQKPSRSDPLKPLRTAAAFLILMLGSALGLAWFHIDVGMPQAQLDVFRTLTGQTPQDERFITVPYCIGVALGVTVFYALPSRKATTPLEVKLTAYQEDMEKTEGRDIE